jgi:hypothetical protein
MRFTIRLLLSPELKHLPDAHSLDLRKDLVKRTLNRHIGGPVGSPKLEK